MNLPTSEERREAFYNKIFFCDVIGYSRLDPPGQFECQRSLNRVLTSVLSRLGCALEEDVIALPTGDGVVLNFLAPEPDIHLRTAILSLEGLNAAGEGSAAPFGLRIGLNSHVDTWIYDINGKRNVVGSGINMAQRIMDLGGNGQILMHDRVRQDLESYPSYASNVVFRGTYGVKHGVEVPVAQFVDESRPYISSEAARPPAAKAGGPVGIDLDQILSRRVQENVLTLRLDLRARLNLPTIQDYVEEFLDGFDAYQRLKVSTSWIVDEVLLNVFQHGGLGSDDSFELKLDRTRNGLQISVIQPDVADFRLASALTAAEASGSFMHMMRARGLRWHERRFEGLLEIGVELPLDVDLRPMPAFELGERAQAAKSAGGEPSPEALRRVVVERPEGRVDESTWEVFSDWLIARVRHVNMRRGALLLDLSAIEYIGSRGLRALTLARREAASGVEIAFCRPNERVSEILAISRYDKMFAVHDDVESARSALAAKLD